MEICTIGFTQHSAAAFFGLLRSAGVRRLDWAAYEARFSELMAVRRVEEQLESASFEDRTVLLCSEHQPGRCHRRLVVEHLARTWPGVSAVHL